MDVSLRLASESIEQAEPVTPVVVQPEWSLKEVMRLLQRELRSTALVCRDLTLVGIFTERDALRVMAAGTSLEAPVSTAMSTDPIAVQRGDSLLRAIQLMASGNCRRLPVVDERGVPIGIVQTAGIVRLLVEYFPRCVYNLPPLPNSPMQEREGS